MVGGAFAILCIRTATVWTWQDGVQPAVAGEMVAGMPANGGSQGSPGDASHPIASGELPKETLPQGDQPADASPADPSLTTPNTSTPTATAPNVTDVAGSAGPATSPAPVDDSASSETRPPQVRPAVKAEASLTLRNPRDSKVTLHFAIGREVIAIAPGEERSFPADGPRVIRFDRGGSFGKAKVTLERGLFEFRAQDKGWELAPVKPR